MTEDQRQQMENTPFAISFSCVDMVLTIDNLIVFIKKSYKDNFLRLPGGMVDPDDLSLEDAALRELSEEVNASLDATSINPEFKPKDFLTADTGRYSPDLSKHRLRTRLFHATTLNIECLQGLDDADGLLLVPIKQLQDIDWVTKNIAPGHIPLIYYWLGQRNASDNR